MQTFLPFPDFRKSLEYLDDARLWKQVLETYQLANGQWPHHHASKMWTGYHGSLHDYGYVNVRVALERGINVPYKHIDYFNVEKNHPKPWWFGDERFHKSHLENLHWKWKPIGKQPMYVWPVHKHEWEFIRFGIRITRNKKPVVGIRKELVDSMTTTGKPCQFLLENFECMLNMRRVE